MTWMGGAALCIEQLPAHVLAALGDLGQMLARALAELFPRRL
jgi:hypothetical protein